MPPPKRVEMGTFYRVLRPMELSAGLRYTTRFPAAVLPAPQRPARMCARYRGRDRRFAAGPRAACRPRRALVWRGRGHYRGRGARARGGRRGVSTTDLRRTPRGAAGAAAAARGAWESGHTPPIHLWRANIRLGAGAETAGPVR